MVKRGRTEISVESVSIARASADNKVAARNPKADGAWRYPGGVIQRAEHLLAKGYTDDKDTNLARRKHESNLFITINTNRSISEGGQLAETGKEAMRQVLEDLSTDAGICSYLKFGPKSTHYKDDKYEDVIQSVEWKACVETGPNNGRLHCHIWLTVHHFSQIQINVPILAQIFKNNYNTKVTAQGYGAALRINKKPYCSVKLMPTSDWAMVMRQYILKAMTPTREVPDVFLEPK